MKSEKLKSRTWQVILTQVLDTSPWSLKFTKDLGFKAKAKDLGIKAKAKDLGIKAKDLEFKAKAKDLRIGP